MGLTPSAAADARLENRISFDVGFAAIYITALYGVSVLKVYSILYLNYKIATKLPKTYVPTVTWIFNLGILFTNKLYDGYPLTRIAMSISPGSALVQRAEQLDSLSGLVGRWEILFNITVLRLISFNLDYYWNLNQGSSSPIEVCMTLPRSLIGFGQLIVKRRNNLILPTYQKEIASLSRQNLRIIPSITT